MTQSERDLVFLNGKVVTADESFSIRRAVAVRGGKILCVGTDAEVVAAARPGAARIDLKGRTVLPGFVDTHPHVTSEAVRGATLLSLSGLESIEAVKRRIAERVRVTPPGEWVVTSPIGVPPYYLGVPESLAEERWPTRWDLDEVSPEHPVYITPPSSRAPNTAVLNSRGLELMGIGRDAPAELDGVGIVKDAATGEPNGRLHGMQPIYNSSSVLKKLTKLLPSPRPEAVAEELRRLAAERSAAGITTIYEGHAVTSRHLRPCVELWRRDELPLRVCFAYEVDVGRSLAEIECSFEGLAHATGAGFGDDRLKLCGVTVSPDGPIRLGLGAMNRPYRDPAGARTTGTMYLSAEKFEQIALLAARYGLRLNSCVGGDRAADVTLEVFEAVDRVIPIRDRRWVVQHIRFSDDRNIARYRELGVHVTVCTNFEWGEGTAVYVNLLGGDFPARAMPLRRWLDGGVPVALSTDFGPYDPMFTLWQCLERVHGATGKSFAGPDQRVTRREAIRMYTIEGARVLFWDEKVGSLEPGKLADLVVLDNDVLECPVDEIRDTRVVTTVLGGRVVFGEGPGGSSSAGERT